MRLLASGSNAKGQLGTGNDSDAHRFTQCSFAPTSLTKPFGHTFTVVQAAFGANHTVLLCEDSTRSPAIRTLWCAGDGSRGQLGVSPPRPKSHVFRKLDLGPLAPDLRRCKIQAIAACWETTFVVLRREESPKQGSDTIISLGSNDFGECGVATPKRVPSARWNIAINIVSFTNCVQNSGLDPTTPHTYQVKHLATGIHHIVAVLCLNPANEFSQSIIVGWGASRHGQLQLRESVAQLSTDALPQRKTNGTPSYISTPNLLYIVPLGEIVKSIDLGQQHTVVLLEESSGRTRFLYAGSNRKGQLGIGVEPKTPDRIPRSIHCNWNGTFVASEVSSGSFDVVAAGNNGNGQLGSSAIGTSFEHDSKEPSSSRSPTSDEQTLVQAVRFPEDLSHTCLQRLSCGSEHSLAILSQTQGSSTKVFGWGWNEHGNLGVSHTNDVSIPIKVWPPDVDVGVTGRAINAWAGIGTSWLLVE